MYESYLLLGSNMGDRVTYLRLAREALAKIGSLTRQSALYETAPWGRTDQPAFLNQSLGLATALSPEELLQAILQIEIELGRMRFEKYGPRSIDIDILLYEDQIHQSDTLTIPHPELPNRRFALTALAEIAASRMHPVLHQTIEELLERCTDTLAVTRIDESQ